MSSTPQINEAVKAFETAQVANGVPYGTIKQYRHVLARFTTRYRGRHVGGIKTEDLWDFLYGPDGILVGRASKTGTSYRSALNSFFSYAHGRAWTRTKLTAPPPVFRSHRDRRRSDTIPVRLPEAGLLLMLERSEHPMLRAMVAVGISTAMRISDILKLRCADVDLQTGELFVWVMKTGRFDAMPITLDLEEELRRYLFWYTAETGQTLDGDGYLFPGWAARNDPDIGRLNYFPDPSRKCSYGWAAVRLRPLYRECGLDVPKGQAWHVIRRSVARIYFDRLRGQISHDHALRETMTLLGHLNQDTTEKYLGLTQEREARNANLRGRRFIGVSAEDATVTPIRSGRQ